MNRVKYIFLCNTSTKVYTVSAILNHVYIQGRMIENSINMSITQVIFTYY